MKARPHIMLQGGVAPAAAGLWRAAFPGMRVTEGKPPAMLWQFELWDQSFTLFDSPEPHEFAPTPSWSFLVDLDAADEVDRVLAVLAKGGSVLMPADAYPFAGRFAWVEDRFGISWQLRFAAAS